MPIVQRLPGWLGNLERSVQDAVYKEEGSFLFRRLGVEFRSGRMRRRPQRQGKRPEKKQRVQKRQQRQENS
jgi:hypothetical protein